MRSFWHWLVDNKQWVFSGVGVAVIAAIAAVVRKLLRARRRPSCVTSNFPENRNLPQAIEQPTLSIETKSNSGETSPMIEMPVSGIQETKPTPTEILEAIERLPPFQQMQHRPNYVGLRVVWKTGFGSLRKFDELQVMPERTEYDDVYTVVLKWGPRGTFVDCDVRLAEYPILKLINKDHPIWVSGTIRRVGDDGIYLTEPKLRIE